jgi:hypothetical protein
MPAFLLNPWVIGSTIAFFGLGQYYFDPKGSVVDSNDFIGPTFEPNEEPKSGILTYLDSGFTDEKKGLLGLSILAIFLYSKPWK